MKRKICAVLLALILSAGTAAAAPVRVAVIDTGVRVREEFLDSSKILPGQNYALNCADTTDRVGHGTRVTSLILGTCDGTIETPCRETGVVPLVYYTELASGAVRNGGVDAICRGIYDAVDQYGCRIINLSSGVPGASEALKNAADYAERQGSLLICAAGNDGGSLSYPAAFRSAVAVGSHSEQAEPSAFSAVGPGLTLLAPGENQKTLSIRNAADFDVVSGTSYAAARVSAQAAALLERYPELTVRQVRFLLEKSCRDIGAPGWDAASGYGILDPALLMEHAEQMACGTLLCYWDVTRDDWFFEAVKAITETGIMSGTREGYFSPGTAVTRATVAVMLHRLAGAPAPREPAPFEDVSPESWCADAAAWAGESGLMVGDGRRFAPDEPLTREQLAVILYRCGPYSGESRDTADGLSRFSDAGAVSPWAEEAVRWACAAGLLEGTGEGTLSPSGHVDRAQGAAVFSRWEELCH